jgi:hypothetical protein
MIDEPLIVPFSPAEAVARIARVLGIVRQNPQLATEASALTQLEGAQTDLLEAIADGHTEGLNSSLAQAQNALLELHAAFSERDAELQLLGFPTAAQLNDPFALAAPDEKSVVTTFTLNGKQVLTSIAIDRAPGATAYWLHVVRYWEEDGETQRIEDPVMERIEPLFARVRLPIGQQILRIKSRNPSTSQLSAEFTIEVPDLNLA